MCADHRGVDDAACFVELELELSKDVLPPPGASPVSKPVVDRLPRAESFREVTPRHASTRSIEHRLDEDSVAEDGLGTCPILRKVFAEARPLFVAQGMTCHEKL
jgi:hypothetical protein